MTYQKGTCHCQKNEIVAELIRRIEDPEFKPNINKDLLIQLVSLFIKFMSFKINSKFYQQANSLFIGSPSTPFSAEICIQRCEEISIYNMIHAPKI